MKSLNYLSSSLVYPLLAYIYVRGEFYNEVVNLQYAIDEAYAGN